MLCNNFMVLRLWFSAYTLGFRNYISEVYLFGCEISETTIGGLNCSSSVSEHNNLR